MNGLTTRNRRIAMIAIQILHVESKKKARRASGVARAGVAIAITRLLSSRGRRPRDLSGSVKVPRYARDDTCFAASTCLIPERVPPLLDHLGDALVDLGHCRPDGLEFADRLGARRRRHLRAKRDGEVLGVDLRRLDRIEIFHEELGGIGMLGA